MSSSRRSYCSLCAALLHQADRHRDCYACLGLQHATDGLLRNVFVRGMLQPRPRRTGPPLPGGHGSSVCQCSCPRSLFLYRCPSASENPERALTAARATALLDARTGSESSPCGASALLPRTAVARHTAATATRSSSLTRSRAGPLLPTGVPTTQSNRSTNMMKMGTPPKS